VPIGAVGLVAGRVVGSRHNERELQRDPTAHAEMLLLREVAGRTPGWRLNDLTVVVTLEPCPMCAGAIVQARIPQVYYGAADPKAGACHSLFQLTGDVRLNHQAVVIGGLLKDESRALLQEFFAQQRKLGKK